MQITTQGTAEEQFTDIAVAAQAEALIDINDILTGDEDSVDYSAQPLQTVEVEVQVETPNSSPSDSDNTTTNTPDSPTDSSLDTSSIEVIQPNKGLEIQLPINPPQWVPPNTPQSPRTNVAVPTFDGLLTDNDEDGNQVAPPPLGDVPTEQGRPETLSPTPQITQSVCSAIGVTIKDLEQGIADKCAEVDLQLSTHRDWSQPNYRLCQDICDLLPTLYQVGFNTECFLNLEKYLYETVGLLLYQSLLRIALDSVFEEFPEISAIQTKVYHMLKCHLSIINHSLVTQFDDITLTNHEVLIYMLFQVHKIDPICRFRQI